MKSFAVIYAAIFCIGATSAASPSLFSFLSDAHNERRARDLLEEPFEAFQAAVPKSFMSNIVESLILAIPRVIEVVPGFAYDAFSRVMKDEEIVDSTLNLGERIMSKIMEDEPGAEAAIDALFGAIFESGMLDGMMGDMAPAPLDGDMAKEINLLDQAMQQIELILLGDGTRSLRRRG